MPAIRYLHNATGTIVTPTSSGIFGLISVRRINATDARLPWLGFICRAGILTMPEGAYAKLNAMEVTADDGDAGSNWIRLNENQFVLGWRVLHVVAKQAKWGVYAIIDSNYCPVVMTEKESPKPKKKGGNVTFIDQRKKPGAKIESDKRA